MFPNAVQHDPAKGVFFIILENDVRAVLEYEWIKENLVNLFHTEVPAAYRGKGLAQELAKAALDYVVAKDAKMVLSCSYLAKYVRDNPLPQYTDRICMDSCKI
jgi:hypothetical protein